MEDAAVVEDDQIVFMPFWKEYVGNMRNKADGEIEIYQL